MSKKSFFRLFKQDFYYKPLDTIPKKIINISSPKHISLYIKESSSINTIENIKNNKLVKSKQKISLSDINTTDNNYAISSISGIIKSISSYYSANGEKHKAILIQKSDQNDIDDTFESTSDDMPVLEKMINFLCYSPGYPPIKRLLDKKNPIKTLLICGTGDLFLNESLLPIINDFENFNNGIDIIKTATNVKNIIILVPENSIQNYSNRLNANIKTVSSIYPHAQPLMILHNIIGNIPKHNNINSTDVCFFKPEAVASIGKAFKDNILPVTKKVILIDKNSKKYALNVHIGTHIEHVFNELKIKINYGDKIIFGGPMTGKAIHSKKHPILPDTDIVIIQDKENITKYENYACINCGECVRVCPANIPINILVRILEARCYEEAVQHDIYSCIECALCDYVCVSKIPIFQYIKLAKHKLSLVNHTEVINE